METQSPSPFAPLFLPLQSHLRSRVGLGPLNTLGDVLGEIAQADIEQLLLVLGDLANWVDLLNTVWSEFDICGEEVASAVLVQWAVDECWLNDTLLALSGLQQALGEAGTSHGHGESCRSGTALGLDNLVTTELHAADVLIVLLAGQGVSRLGEERNDGGARVTTNNGDVLVGGVGALELGDEAAGANDVKGGDTKETLWVVDTSGLENLGADWDGGVDLAMVRECALFKCKVVSSQGWR
jgi:hypothetical protein